MTISDKLCGAAVPDESGGIYAAVPLILSCLVVNSKEVTTRLVLCVVIAKLTLLFVSVSSKLLSEEVYRSHEFLGTQKHKILPHF